MPERDEQQETLKQAIGVVLRSGADFEFKRDALAALVAAEAGAERQRILRQLAAARDELEQSGFAYPFKDGLISGVEHAMSRIEGTESELDARA